MSGCLLWSVDDVIITTGDDGCLFDVVGVCCKR